MGSSDLEQRKERNCEEEEEPPPPPPPRRMEDNVKGRMLKGKKNGREKQT